MPRLEYERINWENAPSTETPLNAENLNIMDNAIAALFSYLGELEQRVDSLSQQDATNMTATFGEPGEEGVDDAPLQPSGSSIGNIITGIHSRIRAFQAASELKSYYGLVSVTPTPGSTFKTVTARLPVENYDHIVALIPLSGYPEEELLEAADGEEEESEPNEPTTEVSGVVFEGVIQRTNQIWCRFIGPVAENYTIHYLFLYY